MHKIKKKDAILVVLVALTFNIFMLGIHGVSLAAGTEKQYTSEGFSLTLPENWGEVPYNVLKEYEKTLNETIAKGGSEQFYAHAFQLKSAKKTFEYPYVLIQIRKDGKIPQSKLEKIKTFNFNKTNEEIENKSQHIISQINIDEPVYDSQARIIWIKGTAVVQGKNMLIISAVIPTESGVIQVTYSTIEAENAKYEQDFMAIVKSIKVSDDEQYKMNWYSLFTRKMITDFILFTLVSIVVGVILKVRKRKTKEKSN